MIVESHRVSEDLRDRFNFFRGENCNDAQRSLSKTMRFDYLSVSQWLNF